MRKFVWKKWKDPNSPENNIDTNNNNTNNSDTNNNTPEYNDSYGYNDVEIPNGFYSKMLGTPLGSFNLSPIQSANDYFDFWILQTNFKLTEPIVAIINNTSGVEILEPYTQYTMRIGFPKSGLFNIDEVKQSIEDKIRDIDTLKYNTIISKLGEKFHLAICEKISETYNDIANIYDKWAIYALPNGSLEIVLSDDAKLSSCNFSEKVKVLKIMEAVVGGKVISSEDY